MSQESDTSFSSDSNILYKLVEDGDSDEADGSDMHGDPDTEDVYDAYDPMQSDSDEENLINDLNNIDIESDDTDVDVAASDPEDIRWSKKAKFDPDLPAFDGEFALKGDVDLPKSPSPYDFFNLFLTKEIVDHIVLQSNLYRTQQNFKQEPMSSVDFLRLLGFLFYSSLCKLPSKSDYWSAACGLEIIMKNITRDRISQLLRSLHFGDNALLRESSDKIQSLIELFNDRCISLVDQEKKISIDEQMIPYKGNAVPKNYKQYMPNKPVKRGFRLWTVSGVSAYTYHITLYKGAKSCESAAQMRALISTTALSTMATCVRRRGDKDYEKLVERHDDTARCGQSGMIVLDLMKGIKRGSHVFVDNYFASLPLLREMTSLGYGLTCTFRSNRIKGCPIKSEKIMKKYPRGYFDYVTSNDGKIIVVAWQDRKRVLLGSNHVGIDPMVTLSRWSKEEQQKINVDGPQIVKMYNKHKGGVDSVDMLCALHPIPFRSKKWYMRIAWRVFDLMLINSWVLWRRVAGDEDTNWRNSRLFYFKMAVASMMLNNPKTIERKMMKDSRQLSDIHHRNQTRLKSISTNQEEEHEGN